MNTLSTVDSTPFSRFRVSLCLFCALFGVYLLAYVSQPDSSDEKAIIATSASFVQHARYDMNAVGASDWLLLPLSRLGTFGQDGALYAKKGITPALFITPLVALAQALPWLSIRATAMLFNALITAFTAVAVFNLGAWLGYRRRTALTVSLIYGLATLAAVYVKTAFGEPLVGLLLLLTVIFAYHLRQPETRHIQRYAIACGTLLALIIGVNLIYAIFVPLLAFYLFVDPKLSLRRLIRVIPFVLPILIGLVALMVFNLARFGGAFNTGYNFGLGEGFTHPFWRGLYGLTVGAQRGIFWYSPIMLLCIPGWLMFRRAFKGLSRLLLALIVVQFVAFAGWWSWHGGIVWGPRFVLPAIPLAVLFLLPVVETSWKKRWILGAWFGLSALSAGIQGLGIAYSYFPYISYLFRAFEPFGLDGVMSDSFFFNPQYSPIIGHLALLTARWQLQPAWVSAGIDPLTPLITLALIGVGWLTLRLRPRVGLLIAVMACLIALNGIVSRQQGSVSVEAVRALEAALNPPAVTVGATTLFDDALVDIRNGSRVITMNAPTRPDDARAVKIWQYALRQDRLLWYLTWFNPANPENWQERALWERAFFVSERTVGQHRALLFDLSSTGLAEQPGGWTYANGVQVAAYAVRQTADGVYLSIEWQTAAAIGRADSWFIHLLDSSGAIVAQQDRQPQGGYLPITAWPPGQRVTDRLFFPIPGERKGWNLRIGWVDSTTGQPLTVTTTAGVPVPDPFVIVSLR